MRLAAAGSTARTRWGNLQRSPRPAPYSWICGMGKRWIRIARERDREKERWEGRDKAGRGERQWHGKGRVWPAWLFTNVGRSVSGLLHLVQSGGVWAGYGWSMAGPNVTAHPSTASVPITVLLYNGPLLCVFNLPIKGLTLLYKLFYNNFLIRLHNFCL